MASYYATAFVTSPVTQQVAAGAGSFLNICIDGRLCPSSAAWVATTTFQQELGADYVGFAIQKLDRGWDYTNPVVVDNVTPAENILFLL